MFHDSKGNSVKSLAIFPELTILVLTPLRGIKHCQKEIGLKVSVDGPSHSKLQHAIMGFQGFSVAAPESSQLYQASNTYHCAIGPTEKTALSYDFLLVRHMAQVRTTTMPSLAATRVSHDSKKDV